MLRQWRDSDLEPFAELNADEEVMRHFPATLDRAASDALVARLAERIADQGVGLWAVEVAETKQFVGFTGLNPMPDWSPGAGLLEVGWRLRRDAWGFGYASEAAREAVRAAAALGESEVWSLTAATNTRSVAVMKRLGLTHVASQDHPDLPEGHPLRPHVFYRGATTQRKR